MRKLFSIVLCLSALLLAGCVQEIHQPGGAPGFTLTVISDEPVHTKSEAAGSRYYRENLISWVDFFFYPGEVSFENGQTENAVMHVRRESGQQDSATFQLDVSSSQVNELFPDNNDKVSVFVVANLPEKLPEGASTKLQDLKARLVTTDFSAPADHRQDRFLMYGMEALQLEDRTGDPVCTGTIRMKRYASKMTVAVHVDSLVTMLNDFLKEEKWHPMLDGMEIYLEDGVKSVRLGGRDSTTVSYFSYENNRKRFLTKDSQTGALLPLVDQYSDNNKLYYETFPMYMYPQKWVEGSTAAKTKEPYLKLIVPWYREEDDANDISSTQKQCYYKILMPDSFNQEFRSNDWYHLSIDVTLLGALTDEEPVQIKCTSYVVYWQNKDWQIKQAQAGRARYLMAEQTLLSLNNLDEVNIPYVSSHPIAIKDIRVTRPYFGEYETGKDTLGGTIIDSAGARYLIYNLDQRKAIRQSMEGVSEEWLKDSASMILFRHKLQNDFKQFRFDYSPYTITFTISHADTTAYQENIRVIQYPAIYISRIRNSDPEEENGQIIAVHTENKNPSVARSKYYGFVFVDGAWKYNATTQKFDFKAGERQQRQNNDQSKDDYRYLGTDKERKEYQWRAVFYTGGSIDMFNITTTVLPKEFNFIIGDPRTSVVMIPEYSYTPENNGKLKDTLNGFSVAPSIYGDANRSLQYYYPTEVSSRTKYMLAPSYRISSKFGGTEFGDITLEYAQRRCAAYQEDGFPAGRWRLPTLGEVSFIAQLSNKKQFAVLFNEESYYWSAHGAVYILKNSAGVDEKPGRTTALLRCVYDTWYWGEDQSEYDSWRRREMPPDNPAMLRNQFVWGDKPR